MKSKFKIVSFSLVFCFLYFKGVTQSVNSKPKSVLMVVSSYGKDKGNLRPGFELDEVSQAYYIFKNNGLKVTIASPKGGKVEADNFNPNKAYNNQFTSDSEAMALLENTLATVLATKDKYDAIYVVGGKGAMFDLPTDPSLQDLIKEMYLEKKVIASVCHGAAAFVNVKINDSTFLVKNREISGFCNEEETRFGKKWVKEFPYLLETKLKERGANYKSGAAMLPFVLVDGQFITGQNPYSTTEVAEEIVKSLGIIPLKREHYADEKSMLLVKKALAGNFEWARNELSQKSKEFDTALIAIYGYYGLIFAQYDLDTIDKSLKVIDLVRGYYFNENLELEKAKALIKLKRNPEAKEILKELVNKKLLENEAKKLIDEMK